MKNLYLTFLAILFAAVANGQTITGTYSVCVGATRTLTGTPTGSSWSVSATGVATVSPTGEVTGITAGTTYITYGSAVEIMTVNPNPALISGMSLAVCVGETDTLVNLTPGGTWESSAPGIGSIDSMTGVTHSISAGVFTITYTAPSTCYVTRSCTVNAGPDAITGPGIICIGTTATQACTPAGGTWSSSNTAVGPIGSTTGIITGITPGTPTISYTLSTGCSARRVVTVTPLPPPIMGLSPICPGSTTTLSIGIPGGTWTSANPSVATVGSTTGIVTGVSVGTTVITYLLNPGCVVTVVATVTAAPGTITGASSICMGSTATESCFPTGGTWSSGSPGIATIGSATGIVTAVAPGLVNISYTVSGACYSIKTITINALPAAITGTAYTCVGYSTTLACATGGGTWSTSATAIASIGTGTGVATGIAAGTANISYTVTATGCSSTMVLTVVALGVIIGPDNICDGSGASYSSSPAGGVWSSSNLAVATIGSATGIVTSVSSGTSAISYTNGTGCLVTKVITVYAVPTAIGGTATVCPGMTTTLSSSAGGTWSSDNVSVATIDASGVVTGVTAGTANISYTSLTTGCSATRVVTVTTPTAISGTTSFCMGTTATLTCGTPGGTWISSNTTIAAIGSASGIMTGLAPGTATITYAVGATGCITTHTVTVNPAPAPFAGVAVCMGQTATLSSSTGGGTWISGNTSVATIGITTAVVTGVTAGTSTITYSLGGICVVTAVVTISALPSIIAGTMSVCEGLCSTLTDASPGGTWSISPTGVATIVPGTGVYCGLTMGTATVTYTTGCSITTTITVNALPAAITGTLTMCPGTTADLSDAPAGGTWASSNWAVLTIASGVVTAVAPGTSVITYTLPTGCFRTAVVTVNPLPDTIGGTATVCQGSTTTLTDATPGGTWASSVPTVAVIGSTSGLVTGITGPGTTFITYTITSTGCFVTRTVTVNPLPAPITGTLAICDGTGTSLSSSPPGGTWSSGATIIAAIGSSSGLVAGVSSGMATISYTLPTGCRRTAVVTVNTPPAAIGGTGTVCEGLTTTLTDATPGGVWTSGTTAAATVGTGSGIVTGISSPATSIITYTLLSTGCFVMKTVTVNTIPATITGTATVCSGQTTSLSSTTAGGAWISDNTAIATVNPTTGVVTGVSGGAVNITYMVTSGCYTIRAVTVNTSPAAISGPSAICEGSSGTMTCAPGGGTWASSMTVVATIDATGSFATLTSGVTTISYTTSSGCFSTKSLTVNPLPVAIMGTAQVCDSSITILTCATPGGAWSSSDVTVASIDATGTVSGNTAGTATISYVLGTGCSATVVLTVIALPVPIVGPSGVCTGGTVAEFSSPPGGFWNSSDASIASIDYSSGVVTGNAPGMVTITYVLPSGCIRTKSLTVNTTPAAITGATSVCEGSTATIACATAGGVWTSSNTVIASVGITTGIVSGLSAGVVNMSYTLGSCYSTRAFTVNITPAAITGAGTVCNGGTTTLSCTTTSGTWSSSDIAIGTIDASGVISSVAPGTTTISYTMGSGCASSRVFTVLATPASITGTASMCAYSSTTLACTTTGGTWSSSTTSVATVSSAGVVTAVTSGTSTISYTLGTGCSTTRVATVNPAPGITGTPGLCTGATTSLSAGIAGGTWTSTSSTITVDAGGVVSATSTGTATISYTLGTGCYSTAVATASATPSVSVSSALTCRPQYTSVATGATTYLWAPSTGITYGATMDTAFIYPAAAAVTYTVTGTTAGCSGITSFTLSGDRILGHISFGGAAPSGTDARVWLIRYNPSDSSIMATDSLSTCLDGDDPYYEFDGKPAGDYLVKAKLLSSVAGTSDYLPTYGGSAATWDLATPITHTGASDSLHISMLYGTVPTGPGFISGYVYMGAGKGTAADVPVQHMIVYLKNTSGQVLTYTYTDASGVYMFSGIAAGNYVIWPEEMSYYTTSYPVTVSAGVPADNIGFKKLTSSGIIVPWTLPNAIATHQEKALSIHPNPATDIITIENAKGQHVTIFDMLGQKVLTLPVLSNRMDIDLRQLANGVYFVEAGGERFKIIKAER